MAVDKGKKKKAKKDDVKLTDKEIHEISVQSTLELIQVIRLDTLHKLLAEIESESKTYITEKRLRELIAEGREAQDNVGISDAPLPLVDGDDGMPEGDL